MHHMSTICGSWNCFWLMMPTFRLASSDFVNQPFALVGVLKECSGVHGTDTTVSHANVIYALISCGPYSS